MKLEKYLKDHREKPGEFGARIGVKRLAVYRYMRGLRRPAFVVMQRIAEATGGAVTANDFYDMPDAGAPAEAAREDAA